MKHFDFLLALAPGLGFTDVLLLFMLIFTRWLVMSSMIPYLGAAIIPSLVRMAIVSLLSVVTLMMVINKTQSIASIDIITVTLLFAKEALIGFVLGFLGSLIFYAYELLGEILDLSRGASMLRLLVPHIKHQSSPMGILLFQLSLTFFLALGLHRTMIQALCMSFERFPAFSLSTSLYNEATLAVLLQVLSTLLELALRLSLPVLFVCFLIDVAFGLMNRIAPQINAYFLSLPAKMLGGLTMILFIVPLVMDEFENHHLKLASFFEALVLKIN